MSLPLQAYTIIPLVLLLIFFYYNFSTCTAIIDHGKSRICGKLKSIFYIYNIFI